MITTAVILAAGLGSRLKEYTREMPKSFMTVEDKTLIEMSLQKLTNQGIKQIYIGTGHCAEAFEPLKKDFPGIQTIHSEKYESTSSMYTLYNMRAELKESFLLLESDLLYDEKALIKLIESPEDNIVLGSDITDYGDEVFLETDADHSLTGVSKQRHELNNINSILVGISKVSKAQYSLLCHRFEKVIYKTPKLDYELLFAEMKKESPFRVLNAPGLVWCEIDDENDLNRARQEVYPKIQRQEGKQK